jgi:hypothetical protein
MLLRQMKFLGLHMIPYEEEALLKVRKLTESNDSNDDEHNFLQFESLQYKEFIDIDEIKPYCYNVPKSQTFETVDSLTPQYDGKFNYLYQVMISKTHKIKVNGLDRLKSMIDNGRPICLFFVNLNIENLFCNYKLQDFVTIGNSKYVGWKNNGTLWIKNNLICNLICNLYKILKYDKNLHYKKKKNKARCQIIFYIM